jgi:hypothetical protein
MDGCVLILVKAPLSGLSACVYVEIIGFMADVGKKNTSLVENFCGIFLKFAFQVDS